MTTYSVPVPVTTTSLPVIGQPMSQQFIAQQQQPTTFQPMTIQQPMTPSQGQIQQIVTQQPIAQSPVFIPPRPLSPRITNVQPVSTVVNGPPIPSTVQVTTTPSMNGGGQTVSVVTNPQPVAVPVTTVLTQQPTQLVQQPLQGQIQQPQSNLMTIAPYGDKGTAFKVTGAATKNYTTTLKSMGGGFYKNVGDGVPGWVFDNSYYNNVVNFVAQANSGNVAPNSNRYVKRNVTVQPATVTTTSIALPTVSTSTDSAVSPSVTMQNVSWTVPKPDVRMRVRVLVDNMAADYIITQIQPNPTTGNVETAYISPSNNPGLSSKLVIVNGKWQVWGYMQDHSVNFY